MSTCSGEIADDQRLGDADTVGRRNNGGEQDSNDNYSGSTGSGDTVDSLVMSHDEQVRGATCWNEEDRYITRKEACLRLQTFTTLTSKRDEAISVNLLCETVNSMTSLTKEQYFCKRVSGSKYRLGKLFVSTFYSSTEKTLKVTICQYGNVEVSSATHKTSSRQKLRLHVSLRRDDAQITKQKFDISQNTALRVFKYIYVRSFDVNSDYGLDTCFLRVKLKGRRCVLPGFYTIAQREIHLRDLFPDTDTTLDNLFI